MTSRWTRIRLHHRHRELVEVLAGIRATRAGVDWGAPGDSARLVTRILGRERTLTMTVATFEPNKIVTYTST